MNKYTDLIQMLEKIFGKGSVSRTIGTRTNVVRFPKGKQPIDPTRGEFDVEGTAAKNPDLVQTIENSIADRMGDITKMNDQELLTYTSNVRRLLNFKEPPIQNADVVKFGSGEEIKGKGLEQLIEKQGTKNPPTTVAGQLETQGKKLEKAGEDLKEITEPKSVIGDIIKDYGDFDKYMQSSQKTGYVRATVRQIMREDIQAGKLKLPKELQDQVMQGIGEPIDIYRKVYGEGALEQIDSLADDLGQFRTEEEAAKFARSKYTFEPKVEPVDESMTYDELGNLIKKGTDEPEGKADGGRIGYAKGKRVKSQIDKLLENLNKKTKGKKSMESVDPKTGEVTVPKKPIRRAEEPTGTTVMDPEPETIDERAIPKKPIKEFTDDEMIAYIKKYKEEGPTLEEFTKRINEQTGSNFTPEQLAHAYRVKVAYPHSTPIVDSQGKFIGGGLYNPPLDVSISDTETLTESIMQTRKSKGLKVPKKYQKETTEIVETSETLPKAGEGRFTKQQVLEKIIQKTIEANPTDEYVQTTFPNFIKEIRANPELANNENVWNTFTQDFPDNKRLVVYGDDTVDFFTKGENLPEGMKQTMDLVDTYGISMQEARRIKQLEPEDQVMEIKKLQVLKNRTQKYKPGDPITEENFGDTPFAPSQETLDNLKKAREMTKGMNLEEEMNMVLNQYDKSMFIKNEQGIVDVTNPENVQKMALLLKRDHPELYKRLEMEIGNQDNILEDFDVTGRKPNADGGIAGLL
jgi:hypothetical protein